MRDLRLVEEFLLLALDRKRGTFAPFKPVIFKYSMAGAVLQELLERGKMVLVDEKVRLIGDDPCGDFILDEALKMIAGTAKEKKVTHWVGKLSKKSKEFKNRLAADLLNLGVLRQLDEENRRTLLPGKRYRLWFDTPLRRTGKQIHDIVLGGKQASERELRLIALVHACKIGGHLFEEKRSEAHLRARQAMADLSEDDPVAKGIKSSIRNMRFSVVSAIFTGVLPIVKDIL